jgi:tetratricopeptide (TPR) repeat protein
VLIETGDFAEATELAQKAADNLRSHRRYGPNHHFTLDAIRTLGQARLASGDFDLAESELRSLLTFVESMPMSGVDRNMHAGQVASILGECLMRMDRFGEAEPILLDAYERLCDGRGQRYGVARMAYRRIVELYDAWERPIQAAQWRSIAELNAGSCTLSQ